MKQYLTSSEFKNLTQTDRTAYLHRNTNDIHSTLAVNFCELMETEIERRTGIVKKNIIVLIDFFNGDDMLILFANDNKTGFAFMNTTIEILKQLQINVSKASSGNAALLIDKMQFLRNFNIATRR